MLLPILSFFGILFGLIFILRLARIGSLMAFLAAGIIAGPFVLGLFQPSGVWSFLGEIGIMFLWFIIGLEINVKRLWQMRRNIFGMGAAQVMMVVAMLFPILWGITAWSITGTVMVALVLAMSSTSTDLQLLADRNELQSNMGRQTFSILLFQDLLSIPLLALLPIFAGRSISLGAEIIDVVVMSAGLIIGVMIVGRIVLNPLMRIITKLKSAEAMLVAIVLVIALCASAMIFAGLPAGLGAFLAGMLLSETIYRHQIRAEITPFAMLFLGIFFITLGMGLDLGILHQNWPIVAIGVVALVIIKFVAIYIVARVRRVRLRDSFMMALVLAQGGEFGLLFLQTMKSAGISAIPNADTEILTAIIVLSIMTTPLLMFVFDQLVRAGKIFRVHAKKTDDEKKPKPAVIICGFGRVGQIIAKMLESQKVSYIAIDLNVDSVITGQAQGFNAVYGDTSNEKVLIELGLAPRSTRAVVIALDNAATAKRTVRAVRMVAPRVKIFARARNAAESRILLGEGVKEAFPETVESSLLLGYGVLANIGVPENKIEKTLADMREDNYGKLV